MGGMPISLIRIMSVIKMLPETERFVTGSSRSGHTHKKILEIYIDNDLSKVSNRCRLEIQAQEIIQHLTGDYQAFALTI